VQTIGIFTSGGDAPGMNAAIRAVVRTAVHSGIRVKGIRRGYQGMIDGDIFDLGLTNVANILQNGGTMLKTARCEEFMAFEGRKKAYEQLETHDIDSLICIGGNGSYRGAIEFYRDFGLPTIGLPGTIDNDLFGTDYTIGYDTAINTALDAIDKIRDTADSHDRVFLVEVMGRDSGFIALDTGIAGGAEVVLIPEDANDTKKLFSHFDKERPRKKFFSIIVVAEGDENGGARKVEENLKSKYPDIEVRTTILGHIQRGGHPSARDRILASRLGHSAVLELQKGSKNIALGLVNNKVAPISLEEAVSKSKVINQKLIEMLEVLSA
jgi:6-phosphofructokinase 1